MLINALLSPIDNRDFRTKGMLKHTDNWDIDFRPLLRKVRNQGSIGACVAFACSTAREIHEAFDTKLNDYISPWFIYIHRQNQDSEGMYPRDAYKIQQKLGCLPESMCPYLCDFEWNSEKKKMADLLKIDAYFTIEDRQDVIDVMNAEATVTISIPVYGTTGQIWKPENGTFRGYHRVVIVACSKSGILIRNSWGEKWDRDGYIEMSWEDFENNNYVFDRMWAIDKKTKNLTFKARLKLLKYKLKNFFKYKQHMWLPILMVLLFSLTSLIIYFTKR